MIERIQEGSSVLVSGHRGYKARYPENTLLAFQRALEIGVDMLEFDLHMTKDGHIVVIHDHTVDRTTNGTGEVGELTLRELKELDAGGWFGPAFEGLKIPTLEELCELLQGYPDVLLNVEIKRGPRAKATADAAVATLDRYGYMPRSVFVCFDADVLAYLHDRHGVRTQGFLEGVMHNFVHGEGGTYSKMWAAGVEMKLLTPDVVRMFGELGIMVWSYCPDTETEVLYSLGCGVKLMTCNDPVPALETRKKLQLA
ncbi:glycerophosphodiester phosphodiesterase family protein [Paenibacillus thailandensis]|jgi:glycerophosphoryl diester phosphodiesterase|uniref:Glycerophosphodiester phosphodiesterase family protein n=1 Tax=Paenibacillus thailandensis TaxID=393250 RepID=A0ABW5QY60_9BACL